MVSLSTWWWTNVKKLVVFFLHLWREWQLKIHGQIRRCLFIICLFWFIYSFSLSSVFIRILKAPITCSTGALGIHPWYIPRNNLSSYFINRSESTLKNPAVKKIKIKNQLWKATSPKLIFHLEIIFICPCITTLRTQETKILKEHASSFCQKLRHLTIPLICTMILHYRII